MKNEVLQEQYEKLFETLHETMRTQTRELVALVDINHHLCAPQHGRSPSFDMGIPDEERANHQNIDQHETCLNPAASTRSRRSGGRHLLAEGLEGSKAVYRDCRDFLKQRQENPLHICSKINDPRVSKRLGSLLRPRLVTNLGKKRHVLEEHEGTYGDLRKKILVVHDSTQNSLILQLIEEVNKLKVERQPEIPDWNQPRPGPLTRRILDTPFKRRQNKSLVYNSILEMRTQLNTLTSLSPPWHIGCTPTKSDVFSSPPSSLAEL
ncbi:hypothetical protein ACFX1Q_018556 [Malus domestica]